jgi:hypothetical protein
VIKNHDKNSLKLIKIRTKQGETDRLRKPKQQAARPKNLRVAAANLNEKVGLDPAHARDRSWRGNESTELSARTRRSTSGSENQNLRTALQTEAGPDRHALLTKRRKPTRRRNEIRPAQENQAPMSVASARAVRREERGRQSLDKEPKEKQILLALSAKDRTEEESVRKA